MGEVPLYWFLPVTNSPGSGLAFPVSEDVRGILRGMRGNLGRMESAIGEEGSDEEVRRRRRKRECIGGMVMDGG